MTFAERLDQIIVNKSPEEQLSGAILVKERSTKQAFRGDYYETKN